ncbi:sulfocyanin-like copper-binding protein [Sulfobacillus harzensis]|uniref:Sulfocyanin-like C-terminal domain-containing protein n=1 Tax=Sulfobacillus harzensis TaxID=2729629 RepID=A0A7Y0L1M5_9FIRM|nr:sulfocyanin-like copper-binding protein [Sulfobacillus harzensis]NMP21623.1 hypothetical protein [Sulfobacillus harzensis]
MKRFIVPAWTASLALTGMLAACGAAPSHVAVSPPFNPAQWVTQNSAQKRVTFHLYAGEGNRMTFNGYGNGQMVLTVPTGWKVSVRFENVDNAQAHSAMIVPLKFHTNTEIPASALAFSHASTPNPTMGSTYGVQQSFHFAANKSGTFALVCGIPGHAAMGMWDTLVISPTAAHASVKIYTHP